ncbi:hypothetical protein [Curtobacterium sp. PhB136]|uniref:hypothetical protein n=1 Tax=Curtobacterium sp. PhB136 TaxID=2485181 RepID=UPI001047AE2E|nr:hypothetical protein [Curtobacterium sp. PhB136]TCK65787.1 hypothetical protein EDF27_0528 [Curtobacterium sp. PhB136]
MSIDTITARANAFISAATKKHGGRYDYSEVLAEYVNAHTKVTIGCPAHGQFTQEPNEHRRGQRCPDCSGRRNSRPSARRDLFIARAREVHGDRYDYSQVRYVDQHTPVTIVCALHGVFSQRPMNHLSSHTPSNCPDCADDIRPVSLTAAWMNRPTSKRDIDTGEFKKAA